MIIFISPQWHPKINFFNVDPYHEVTDFVPVFQCDLNISYMYMFCFNFKSKKTRKQTKVYLMIRLSVTAVKDGYNFY